VVDRAEATVGGTPARAFSTPTASALQTEYKTRTCEDIYGKSAKTLLFGDSYISKQQPTTGQAASMTMTGMTTAETTKGYAGAMYADSCFSGYYDYEQGRTGSKYYPDNLSATEVAEPSKRRERSILPQRNVNEAVFEPVNLGAERSVSTSSIGLGAKKFFSRERIAKWKDAGKIVIACYVLLVAILISFIVANRGQIGNRSTTPADAPVAPYSTAAEATFAPNDVPIANQR
jgi:hypothetical protein